LRGDTKNPTAFSVLIAVYNCEECIIETLESVCKQTLGDYEVIIVDDCSTDNTYQVVSDFISKKERFYLYRNNQNMGVAFSRNYAISLAQSEYICFLDGDDVWKPDKLAIQYQMLEDHLIDGCVSSYEFIDENSQGIGEPYIIEDSIITYKEMLKQNLIGCSTVALKSEILKNNSFLESVAHEDYALWLKLLRDGYKILGTSKVLVSYRIVSGSRSSNKFKAARNRFRIYRDCEQLSLFKSILLFLSYGFSGIMKYWGLKRNIKRKRNEN